MSKLGFDQADELELELDRPIALAPEITPFKALVEAVLEAVPPIATAPADALAREIAERYQRHWAEVSDDDGDEETRSNTPKESGFAMDFAPDSASITSGMAVPGADDAAQFGGGDDDEEGSAPPPPDAPKPHTRG